MATPDRFKFSRVYYPSTLINPVRSNLEAEAAVIEGHVPGAEPVNAGPPLAELRSMQRWIRDRRKYRRG